MISSVRTYFLPLLLAALMVLGGRPAAYAAELAWRVGKASGDVWVSTSGVQKASLTDESELNPGDNIRTGKNGRVLLVRGEETILIAPNSVVGIPTAKTEGLQTTIVQQAGSILLEVEKRNVKHFEVETPYLAAVVKGTQFRVSVNKYGTNVDVLRGKVEVSDFKTGQFALVLPGQKASVSANGNSGLALSGSGTLSPIQQGKPRATAVERVQVPRGGLGAPEGSNNGLKVRALGDPGKAKAATATVRSRGLAVGHTRGLRIGAPVGDVKLDFQKVTKGLARAATAPGHSQGHGPEKTVWNSDGLNPGNGAAKAYGVGNSNAGGNGNANGLSNAKANNSKAVGQSNAGNNGKGKGKGKGNQS